MLPKTDLESCKMIAKDFLYTEIDTSSKFSPLIVTHPFFSSGWYYNPENDKWLDILNNKDDYNIAIKQAERMIDKTEDYCSFLLIIRKPYLLAFFKYTKQYLDEKDYSEFLINSWVMDEYANCNTNVSKEELLKYFKEASKEFMMDEKETEVFEQLDDVVTIYRGVTDYNKDNIKALSWTLDKTKAEWFATRFNREGQDGLVYEAKIKKNDIFAYTNKRNEKEVLVNYRKLYDIEPIKAIENSLEEEPDICDEDF